MRQALVNLVSNIDFSASWRQWLASLPMIPKILGILAPVAAVTSLILNIPKAYSRLRGTVARIEVRRFSMVERVPGLVDFQLDLCIHASHGNVVAKSIYLKNKNKFCLQYNEPICLYCELKDTPSNKAIVKLATPKTDFEFTQLEEKRFEELLLIQLKKTQICILGFQIPEGSFQCLTMAGRLKGKSVDGVNFSTIPLEGWSILLEYGVRKSEKALKQL